MAGGHNDFDPVQDIHGIIWFVWMTMTTFLSNVFHIYGQQMLGWTSSTLNCPIYTRVILKLINLKTVDIVCSFCLWFVISATLMTH